MIEQLKSVLRVLTYVIIVEVILGGAGRFIAVGPLSIRMLLYGVAFFILFICVICDFKNTIYKFNFRDINIKLILLFFVWIIFSAIKGYFFSKFSLHEVIGDVTGFVSLALIFLFTYVFDDKKYVKTITSVIVAAVTVQGVALILMNFGLALGVLNYEGLNTLINDLYMGAMAWIHPGSIRIFLKSSIYLQVGFLLALGMLMKENSKKKRILLYAALIIIGYSIILSFTRGFWIAAFVTTVLLIIKKPVNFIKPLGITIIGIIILMSLNMAAFRNVNIAYSIASRVGIIHIDTNTETGKSKNIVSNDAVEEALDYRIALKSHMFKQIKKTPILGSGFGIVFRDINQEVSHSEYMYYDIWVEMGLIGLLLYIGMFIAMGYKWLKIRIERRDINKSNYLDEYILAFAGVAVTTALNPFLNNPLGITYLVLVICILNISYKEIA